MNKIVIYARTIFFMCFSSLFLSTKYQKIDDLLICNEFSSIFCEQTNSNLLSQVNVAEESDSEWLWNCYYFSYVCVWFSIPCQQFCQDWKFFSVQVGCVFDKLGALQRGILWYPSVKQQVFNQGKKYLFQKTGLLQRWFSNLAIKMLAKATAIFVPMAVPWVCK